MSERRVPVRTIVITIGLVLLSALAVLFVIHMYRVLVWMLVALFFAVALYPVVNWVPSGCRGVAGRWRRSWWC